jgi:C-terminal processing protease CtpA/Prc
LTSQYVAGNVGAGVLKRFNITFDYARQQLIFERNANDELRDNFDRAGWWLNMSEGGFEVLDVVPGGPAAEAGLKVGDRILAVDGKPAAQVSLPDLRVRLRSDAPGSKVALRIGSGGTTREVTLTLRDLV